MRYADKLGNVYLGIRGYIKKAQNKIRSSVTDSMPYTCKVFIFKVKMNTFQV